MAHRRALTVLALVSTLAASGCGTAAVASIEPSASPAAAVVVTPVPTPRPTPRPEPTPTPHPSATAKPTPVVPTAAGDAAQAGFVAFAGSAATPFHLDMASKVNVVVAEMTIRLSLDVAGDGDMAGEVAAKAGDVTESAELVIVDGRQFVRVPGRAWTEVAGDPTAANPLGELPLDKVVWKGVDTIGGSPLHHIQIDDASVVDASNVEESAITALEIDSGLMDFWVTDAGTPVLARFRIVGSGVARGRRTDFWIVGRYDFSDVGKPVIIEPPIS